MFIHNYGLFWERDEIDWSPGKGCRSFALLGRIGQNRPGLRVCDFRKQQGIYILYNNHGSYYAGLTRAQGLGIRLRQHCMDEHAGNWNRFSWFGFCSVLKANTTKGMKILGKLANVKQLPIHAIISDVEALLIRAMALQNIAQMNFHKAEEWFQIEAHDVDDYLSKING